MMHTGFLGYKVSHFMQMHDNNCVLYVVYTLHDMAMVILLGLYKCRKIPQ